MTPTPKPTASPTPEPTAVPTLKPVAIATPKPTAEPTRQPLPEPAVDKALVGSWKLTSVSVSASQGSYSHALNPSNTLHMHKESGTHLTFGADGSLDTDIDIDGLLKGFDMPFDVPSLPVTGDSFTCDGSSVTFRPSGMTYEYKIKDDGKLWLTLRGTTMAHANRRFTEGEASLLANISFERIPDAAADGNGISFGSLTAGEEILFGRYDQDGNAANGAENIEWIVLDVTDGTATLMSRYVLEARAYNGVGMKITWEKCSLRKWLNGTFLNAAFSESERAALQSFVSSADPNPFFEDVDPGAGTEDLVSLLSINEAILYFGDLNIAPAMPTQTAIAHGIYTDKTTSSLGQTAWWLRTPGSRPDNAAYMISGNKLMDDGGEVSKGYYGVRPVVKVKLAGLGRAAAPQSEPAP